MDFDELKNMPVVILAGGMGSRLREETEFRPKPMIEIGGKPIIHHIMKLYAHYGFKNFILCLGYKGEVIKEYFYNYEILNHDFTIEFGEKKKIELHNQHPEYGWRVTLVDTGEKTLKGARLKRIEKYINTDNFFVTYGDGVSNVDIKKLLKFHQEHEKVATVTGVSAASRFGELITDGKKVQSFTEKPQKVNSLINGGFFVFKKEIFNELSDDENCDLEVGALEELAHRNEMMLFKHQGFWACMDTQRDVLHLNDLWNKGQAKWKVWNDN